MIMKIDHNTKIILLRHGEVDIKSYKKISASQFRKWINEYNSSNIKSEFTAKNEIKNLFNEADVLICSNLKRTIQSVEIFDKTPFEINELFNEAELPSLTLDLLKLNPKIWLIIFRILWFFGYSKNSESYKETKQRAKKATKNLIKFSKQNKTIVFVGHGIMNRLIQKELILENWNKTKNMTSDNWSYSVLELKTEEEIDKNV